jgi:hypothetical protein
VPATDVRTVGLHLLKTADLRVNNDVELFPKSATSSSQIRAPLGINKKPSANGAIGWFDGVESNVKTQLEWLASVQTVDASVVTQSALKIRACSSAEPRRTKSNRRSSNHYKCFSVADVVRILDAKPSGANRWKALCPCHEETTPSLSIGTTNTDSLSLRCFGRGNCSFEQIIRAIRRMA